MLFVVLMIQSFADKDAERLFRGKRAKNIPAELWRRALAKLLALDAATSIDDLRIPPGNHLEKLSGTYRGYRSIRISKGWRVIFKWEGGHAFEVSITNHYDD